MCDKSSQKSTKKFVCDYCDYVTSKSSNWTKHISTLKHKIIENGNENAEKVAINCILHVCSDCNKRYKFKSGLCRHRKNCKMIVKNKILVDLETEVDKLKKENQDLERNTTIINNYNTFQVFLDEKCSNAMSIDNFVCNLQITMSDLFKTQKYGLVEGMSNFIIKNLNTLQLQDRPIHCSDIKNSRFFVKTETNWENDNGTKISNALDMVQCEKMKYIYEHMKKETFLKSENETAKIMDLVRMLSTRNIEKNKIIKNIANTIILDPTLE